MPVHSPQLHIVTAIKPGLAHTGQEGKEVEMQGEEE